MIKLNQVLGLVGKISSLWFFHTKSFTNSGTFYRQKKIIFEAISSDDVKITV